MDLTAREGRKSQANIQKRRTQGKFRSKKYPYQAAQLGSPLPGGRWYCPLPETSPLPGSSPSSETSPLLGSSPLSETSPLPGSPPLSEDSPLPENSPLAA